MSITLRGYQELAIQAAADTFAAGTMQRALIVLSTGLGKTITGLALAKKIGGPTLWLAHTEELVTQPYKAAQLCGPTFRAASSKPS